jgi:trimethylamine--corrinoid protein Co-methyltransferase
MPTWGYAGCTDAKVLDEQAALEALLSVMTAKLSGANLIHDVGYMESGLTGSFEMIVLTNELIDLADHFLQGIEVSEETLMLDEIDQVGPGGHFLNTDRTMDRFRDFWYPTLIDRNRRPEWLEQGGTTLGERLNERVKEILKEHHPEPLESEKKAQVEQILAQAK